MEIQTSSLVLVNARVHTLAEHGPLASALVLQEGIIRYVGDDAGAKEVAASISSTQVIDLHGACVIPGLTDAHMHFEWFSLGLQEVNAERESKQRVLEEVSAQAQQKPAGSWITGYGWNHNVWDGEFPTAADLDAVSPQHPVSLTAKSGHALWVNTLALQAAGIRAQTSDPVGGRIVRDDQGEPTGILLEDAGELVEKVIPVPGLEERISAYQAGMQVAHQLGITGVHDMDGPRSLQVWQVLHERSELSLRVTKSIPLDHLDEAVSLGLRSGFGDEWLRLGAVKIFSDGALGPRTAWMLEPYLGEPKNTGIPKLPMKTILQAVLKANQAGLATAIHAIGDRANREILNVYAKVREQLGPTGLRNRIEHVQLLHPADAPRLAALQVIASMQPIHATSDMEIAERGWGSRCTGAYALKTQEEQGAVLALGSDCPVESLNPLLGIHAAVTRRRADGSPGPSGWHPEQRLTVKSAVKGLTWGPAYATRLENRLGSLQVGKLADLTIIDRDIFAIDPMEILGAQVVGTVVGGKLVYSAM